VECLGSVALARRRAVFCSPDVSSSHDLVTPTPESRSKEGTAPPRVGFAVFVVVGIAVIAAMLVSPVSTSNFFSLPGTLRWNSGVNSWMLKGYGEFDAHDAAEATEKYPLWVISGHRIRSALPPKADIGQRACLSSGTVRPHLETSAA
jgi:hypothetical protein